VILGRWARYRAAGGRGGWWIVDNVDNLKTYDPHYPQNENPFLRGAKDGAVKRGSCGQFGQPVFNRYAYTLYLYNTQL
jgi:hypothetical protein